MTYSKAALLLLLALSNGMGRLSATETGFLNRTVKVQEVEYRYMVYLPVDWTPEQKLPVILFLHGSGEQGSDGIKQTDTGLGHALRTRSARYHFIVVMPQCQKIWMDPAMEAQALAALEQSIAEFNGDRQRVYLTGLSIGGYGTWNIASKYPGRFAAVVPVCGGIRSPGGGRYGLHVDVVDDPTVTDPVAEVARRIGKTPVWIFHGADDRVVPVTESRDMAAALRVAGNNARYTEYPGVEHNSWDRAYAEAELPIWLLQQSLEKQDKPQKDEQ